MQQPRQAFFGGPVVDRIVRHGEDARLKTGKETWREMLTQVARDYPGLPDPRTLTVPEIVFWFEGLRPELKRHTKPKAETPPPRPRKRRPRK
jgi:hypothetical protein